MADCKSLSTKDLFLSMNEYKDYPRNPLEPTTSDAFAIRGLNVHFVRDARKQVAAFHTERWKSQEHSIRAKEFVVRTCGRSECRR